MSDYSIVTGGSTGIGAAIVARFLDAGHAVLVIDRDVQANDHLRVEAASQNLEFLEEDLTETDLVDKLLSTLNEVNPSRLVLVNNASFRYRTSWRDETYDTWSQQLLLMSWIPFALARTCVEFCIENGIDGSVLNLVSPLGHQVSDHSPGYHASKAALGSITRYLGVHAQLSGAQVTVNAIEPGLIVQRRHRLRFESEASRGWRQLCQAYMPRGSEGAEEDVAEAALWLTSRSARFINGVCLVVDGGGGVQEPLFVAARTMSTVQEVQHQPPQA